jgi:hypothetical protein
MFLDLNEAMMEDSSGGDNSVGAAEDDPFLLSTLAPRLWPFMRHNITSVRLAAIRTLVWPSCPWLLYTFPGIQYPNDREG